MVVDRGVALTPGSFKGRQVDLAACGNQILAETIYLIRAVAEKGEGGARTAYSGRVPIRERHDTGLGVKHDPQPAGPGRLGMYLVHRRLGKVQADPTVEVDGSSHIRNDHTDGIETGLELSLRCAGCRRRGIA